MEELEMKVYEKDTSAVAVILYDNGAFFFETEYKNDNSNFICTFERHVRIKILKPEGFDFATFKIPLYHNSDGEEKIAALKAKTYNLDGKILTDKLEKNSIFKEETAPNLKRVKFTMPNIKVGSVQNTIKWNERNRLFCKNSLKKIWKEKSGNTAEINLLLIAMLRKAGIEANPIVLSTRQNGIIHPSHPIIIQINYIIVYARIKDKNYLMDATDPYCPIGILPFRCLNSRGRLITNNKSEWIDLTPNKGAKTAIMSNLKLTEEETVKGNVTEAFYDYDGVIRKNGIGLQILEYHRNNIQNFKQ